jgi:hypothetical protein
MNKPPKGCSHLALTNSRQKQDSHNRSTYHRARQPGSCNDNAKDSQHQGAEKAEDITNNPAIMLM